MKIHIRFFTCFLLALFCQHLCAQKHEEKFVTWDEFVAEYSNIHDDTESVTNAINWEELEAIYQQQLNINAASRSELLLLPFLSEANVDSILAYRDRKQYFLSLGELQFVRGLDYYPRRYLSLFTYAAPLPRPATPLKKQLFKGRHTLETSFGFPLVKRAGYKQYTDEELKENPNKRYLGNALRHTMRYRYRHADGIQYGLTLDKDAGEPFCFDGQPLYDHLAGFFAIRRMHWGVLLGDFKLHTGFGLVNGQTNYGNRSETLLNQRSGMTDYQPYAPKNEADFFRGVAANYYFGSWRTTAFLSYRRRDATMDHDTIRSIQTSGLHRTLRERQRRNVVGVLAAGGNVDYYKNAWNVGAGIVYTHYDHPIYPKQFYPYSQYAFRGYYATTASTYYAYSQGSLRLQGELATDHNFRIATEQTLYYTLPLERGKVALQWRHYPADFVSRYGNASGVGSEVRNENGLMLTATSTLFNRYNTLASIDYFRHPAPTYLADAPSYGFEFTLQTSTTFGPDDDRSLLLRFRGRVRQQSIAGHREILEHRGTHRLRAQYAVTKRRFTSVSSIDASLTHRQSGKGSQGIMFSQRATIHPSKVLYFSAFAAYFYTSAYDAALYIYEPQIPGTMAFPTFAYHGLRGVLLASYSPHPALTAYFRIAAITYFNRNVISSGTEQIDGSWNGDVSLTLKWRF